MKRWLSCFWFGLFAVLHPTQSDAQPTYHGNLKRLVQNECMTCHRSGGIAPFSMETYQSTLPQAPLMKAKVQAGEMPPWNASAVQPFADPEQGLLHDRELTQEQMDLLFGWVDGGALEGDPGESPPNPNFGPNWNFGTPDAIWEMTQDFNVQGGGADIYRCFVVPTGLTGLAAISSLEFQAGNSLVDHHAVVYTDPNGEGPAKDAADGVSGDGFSCFGSSGVSGTQVIAAWAPGGGQQAISERTPLVISDPHIIVQIHYHPSGSLQLDRSRIGVQFMDLAGAIPLNQAIPTRLAGISIPPGESRTYTYSDTNGLIPVTQDMRLHAVFPHMHETGSLFFAWANLPDSTILPLIDVDNWDFDWQEYYVYKKPFLLPAGSTIDFRATFSNNTSETVVGGLFTNQEMLTLGLAWTNDSEGIPAAPDAEPPTILQVQPLDRDSGPPTIVSVIFSEPIQMPRFPYDVDFQGPAGRLTPDDTSANGATLTLTWNSGLDPTATYQMLLKGFYGIADLHGNLLDGNSNGIGGELADDRLVIFAGPNEAIRWRRYE